MGKLLQGILGGVSGKVGNVVGSSWKGIPTIKSMPLSVANPQTASQTANRAKMTRIVAFTQPILAGVIKPLWDRFAQKMSGYNAFISENISLFDDPYPSSLPTLILSKGKMTKTPVDSTTEVIGNDTVTGEWLDDSGEGYKLATDEAYLVVQRYNGSDIEIQYTTGVRSDLALSLDLDAVVASGDRITYYLAFRRVDGTVVSDSSASIVVL